MLNNALWHTCQGACCYRELKLLGQQPWGHTAHKQQPINRSLVAGDHVVSSAYSDSAAVFDAAVAMLADSMQQRESFISCSIPNDALSHSDSDLHRPVEIGKR